MLRLFIVIAYILTALVASTAGAVYMRTLHKFFHREAKKRTLKEKFAFKQGGYRFFVCTMEDQTIEWWAHWSETDDPRHDSDYHMGNWVDGDFEKVENFRKMPWDIQKGSERLRRYMLGKNYSLYDND